ncbi:leucine-rich repeat-containing protein 4 [Diorhabda sublineata]|uniref:leucine-rich repeat-containing protein 4 n=1 Tax=Diorhabda sublineata TaxID=1163346 RepID=UPI0024E08204|nr:leucine-rich repeat-containing protein 4 [Diorhabda sublineata]
MYVIKRAVSVDVIIMPSLRIVQWLWLHFFLSSVVPEFSAMGGICPTACTCKWKGGKQTVECMERGLIAIPDSIDTETQVLDLSGNNLQILHREAFNRTGLINLQRVFLRSCRIGQIDNLAFRGLTNLIELDISHNLLTSVPSGTFKDIPFLRDLIISNNPIQKIESHAFQSIHGLVKLDLSNCEIQNVAPKAFEGIEMLESLKINGNRLSELRLRTVETLTRLHGVELHENPWHCDCRLRSVKEWLLRNNIPYPENPVCSGGPERVIHKTFAELHIDDFACKPEILPVSRFIEAVVGENATITCRINAVPAAQVKWYWNGKQLLNNTVFSPHQFINIYEDGKQEKISNLVLTNVQEGDATEFYCVAENRAGSSEANFTLRVSLRPLGITSLGNGQIAGLSAALVFLILFILVIISILLIKLRRIPFTESKTPGHVEVVTVVNSGNIPNGKSVSPINTPEETSSFTERKPPGELTFCNPIQKPPRLNDVPYSTVHYNGNGSIITSIVSPSSGSVNNPDLINDTKSGELPASTESLDRPMSGEYSRNPDSLYPSGLWSGETIPAILSSFQYNDKTPIMHDGTSTGGSVEELNFRLAQGTNRLASYPSDYGLPIVENKTENVSIPASQVNLPVNAKTLRVWQKGAVPVLPPVTALKRVLTNNRNSPDEGYQEGCGTDV